MALRRQYYLLAQLGTSIELFIRQMDAEPVEGDHIEHTPDGSKASTRNWDIIKVFKNYEELHIESLLNLIGSEKLENLFRAKVFHSAMV